MSAPARNINHDVKAANTRVYATPLAQPYHTDSADAVGLLCLRPGLQGGLSSWASSISVHNELLRRGRRVRPFFRFGVAVLLACKREVHAEQCMGTVDADGLRIKLRLHRHGPKYTALLLSNPCSPLLPITRNTLLVVVRDSPAGYKLLLSYVFLNHC